MTHDTTCVTSEAIRSAVHAWPLLSFHSADSSRKALLSLRTSLGADESSIRWWTSPSRDRQIIPYSSTPRQLFNELLCTEGYARLFITDDEPPPWPSVHGPLADILDLIDDCPFFEYFIVNAEGTRVLFDTHHNELVLFVLSGASTAP